MVVAAQSACSSCAEALEGRGSVVSISIYSGGVNIWKASELMIGRRETNERQPSASRLALRSGRDLSRKPNPTAIG